MTLADYRAALDRLDVEWAAHEQARRARRVTRRR